MSKECSGERERKRKITENVVIISSSVGLIGAIQHPVGKKELCIEIDACVCRSHGRRA